jgi:hypothetical protein
MAKDFSANISEAFNSMLRTDYISLNDKDKLLLLSNYYVDYFGILPEVLSDVDHLIAGRRGTGKTTLLYRAFVECMNSWKKGYTGESPKPRTLGIYVDLSKCQNLDEISDSDFIAFEHGFVSEVCDAITEQLTRFWPELSQQPGSFAKLFRAAESNKIEEVRIILDRISHLLKEGMPRVADKSGTMQAKDVISASRSKGSESNISLKPSEVSLSAKETDGTQDSQSAERSYGTRLSYRLTVADVLRILGQLKEKAGLSATYLFIDEFSALSSDLQRRFSTLLKKLLGSHSGVFIKVCAITDKYTLGSSIILQRDLFDISLDLDAFVERSQTLNEAMDGLELFTSEIVRSRLAAYKCPVPESVFDEPSEIYSLLSKSAMGVPRTIGIVLKQALNRSRQGKSRRIRKSDVNYGIKYASMAYLNQMLGAARDGMAIPGFHADMWNALIARAQVEKAKVPDASASHFMILTRNEQMLSVLNMFFLVHLLTKGRTTKKERSTRNLYCFDYGICEENNLDFKSDTDKNVIRQQRFAYDDTLIRFEKYFGITEEDTYRCPQCGNTYTESQLMIAGTRLIYCPLDRTDLVKQKSSEENNKYTEEEIKIIGSIRSSAKEDNTYAREVADDVGCYVQKVAKFGEKLDKEGIVGRAKDKDENKLIYFAK